MKNGNIRLQNEYENMTKELMQYQAITMVMHLSNRYTSTDVHTRVINMTNMRTFYADRHGKMFSHCNLTL